jgi:NADPH-dependent 2,4-dienoyl-CoA reductase/sulfur reductase-like enzyme/nitrite reductase/ring-hydroxylating ferredoxin subunit
MIRGPLPWYGSTMSETTAPLTGPDFTQGVELSEVPEDGKLLGHAHGVAVLLVRHGGEVFAVAASCTHYGGPLADGIVTAGEVRCPWHHACFDARTGEAVRPPALNPLARWAVEHRGSRIFVGQPLSPPQPRSSRSAVESVVIVGAGAAGNAAAEALRREGYSGPVTMIGAERDVPVDRPNLSKDYLAGTASEDWVPLRGAEFYSAQQIELLLGTPVAAIDPRGKRIRLSDGTSRSYGALLLATGADPVKLTVPGGDGPLVHYLRSLADSRAIIASAKGASCAVVVGASFIGLEVAAALRTRGLEVRVVAPDARPLERIMGAELGDFVRALHEEHGVVFHLGHTLKSIGERSAILDDGTPLPADLIVVGIGVRPAVALAEQAGLRLDRGVLVDEYLETSAPGVYAAGDIARWPDPHTGKPVRIEHWAVAEQQGQTAARNILGAREPFRAVPFFWSQHYDVPINYVGHAEGWDRLEVAGSIPQRSCLVAYRVAGKISAVASIYRDQESLRAEALLERGDQAGLESLLASVRA